MNQQELLGIPRIFQDLPKIELIDEREGNHFKVVVCMNDAAKVGAVVDGEILNQNNPQVPHKYPASTPQVTEEVGTKLGLCLDQVRAQPELLVDSVLFVGPMGITEISQSHVRHEVSGQFNKTRCTFLTMHRIEMTISDTNKIRLQKYWLKSNSKENKK